MLGRSNYTAKQIMSVSGHKSVQSVAHYQKIQDDEKMMMGLSLGYLLNNESMDRLQHMHAQPLPENVLQSLKEAGRNYCRTPKPSHAPQVLAIEPPPTMPTSRATVPSSSAHVTPRTDVQQNTTAANASSMNVSTTNWPQTTARQVPAENRQEGPPRRLPQLLPLPEPQRNPFQNKAPVQSFKRSTATPFAQPIVEMPAEHLDAIVPQSSNTTHEVDVPTYAGMQVAPETAQQAVVNYDHQVDEFSSTLEDQDDFSFDLAAIVADVQEDEEMQEQSSQLVPKQIASAAQMISNITNTNVQKTAPNMPFFHGCKIGNINIVMRK
jgi:hypothetical protein